MASKKSTLTRKQLKENMVKQSKSAAKKAHAKAWSDKDPTPKKFQGANRAQETFNSKLPENQLDNPTPKKFIKQFQAMDKRIAAHKRGLGEAMRMPQTEPMNTQGSDAKRLFESLRAPQGKGVPFSGSQPQGNTADIPQQRSPVGKPWGRTGALGAGAAGLGTGLGAGLLGGGVAMAGGAMGASNTRAAMQKDEDTTMREMAGVSESVKPPQTMQEMAAFAAHFYNVMNATKGGTGTARGTITQNLSGPDPENDPNEGEPDFDSDDTAPQSKPRTTAADIRASATKREAQPTSARAVRKTAVRETGGALSDEEIADWNRKNNPNYRN